MAVAVLVAELAMVRVKVVATAREEGAEEGEWRNVGRDIARQAGPNRALRAVYGPADG